MPVQFKLDYVVERTLAAAPSEEQRLLNRLAGARLSAAEARTLWPRVLEHKWYVSERLGRDVGLRVAAIDYLENVRLPRPASAGGRETIVGRLRRALQPLGVHV
ncbi:MAG TPA: DUF4032 domain-containing protein [Pyrinomonadaceae bacterium]|nr:DUF4032 domain-containing protein [Pyrinomonadaceae bacterium]